MSDPRPIGVFDSGIGGLTVLRALVEAFGIMSIALITTNSAPKNASRSQSTA